MKVELSKSELLLIRGALDNVVRRYHNVFIETSSLSAAWQINMLKRIHTYENLSEKLKAATEKRSK